MKKRWIPVTLKLPKFDLPVLCIVRADCACDHYGPIVLSRIRSSTGSDPDWDWVINAGKIMGKVNKSIVYAWQQIDEFPKQYNEGFER